MVVDRVHEIGRQVDLGAVVVGEVAEVLGRQSRSAVLHRARQTVLFARDLRDGPEDLEVDGDPHDRAVGGDDAAVGGTRLDRDFLDPVARPESAPVDVHVRPELLRRRVSLADLADLAAHRDRHRLRLVRADELREARAECGVDLLLLLERRLREVHEGGRVDVDLEEARRDRIRRSAPRWRRSPSRRSPEFSSGSSGSGRPG